MYADGIIGGFTITSKLEMNFYTEQSRLPNSVMYELNQDFGFGEEIDRDDLPANSSVRQIHTSLVMDLDKARSFSDWLIRKLDEYQNMTNDQSKPQN